MSRLDATALALTILADCGMVTGEEPAFPTKLEWGEIVTTPTAVELHVASMPHDRFIRMPRFNNPYKRIYLKSDKRKTPLEFRPEVTEWLIKLPKAAATPEIVVIDTVGAPQLLTQPFVTRVSSKGVVILPAHHAIIHGKLLRFEPQPHKNTVGYWANEKDWCQWQIEVDDPGEYEVHILQGCGEGHGGSEVQISIGKSALTFVVEDTGHFQNFKERNVGKLKITTAGRNSLKVVPVSKAKGAVMDVRQIELILADR